MGDIDENNHINTGVAPNTSENNHTATVVTPDNANENNDAIIEVAPDTSEPAAAPTNDGKLLLTVIKYDSGTAKLLPGGRLAPTPSQLATSPLGIIRAHLFKDGYLKKADGNKPFCTKDGIEVTDNITFDHYIEENSQAKTPGTTGEIAVNENGRPTKHNIYILTKKRETKKMDPNVEAFLGKPLDLSNTAKVDFATASTGVPLTSSFTNSSWAAEGGESIIHPADMTEKEWGIVMRNNNLLSGQVLQKGPVEKIIKVQGQKDIIRPAIDVTNVEKAYYSAFALKPRKLPDYDITFTITEKAEKQMNDLKIQPPNDFFRIPRFHIKDASQVRVFETRGSLETSMADSSFTANSIDAAVGGTAFGMSAAVKAGGSWSKDEKSASSRFNDTSYMHVVYEFPRVELILNEENLELSNECKADIQNLRHRRTLEELDHFEKRYGIFFTRSVHLGGKLVSIDESDSVAGASVSEKAKMLKAAASASVSGYGFQAEVNYSHTENSGTKTTSTEKRMTHSMSWSAEGGETTLCNNPPKWCPTVASFYNWRVMKQDDVINIYKLIGKLPGYEDIPTLVQNILHINPDPKSLVQFSLHLQPDAEAKHDKRTLYFGWPEKGDIAQLNMDPDLTDLHSLRPHEEGLISDVTLREKSEEYRPYGTAFGIPISAGQANIDLEEAKEADILYPRLKYGVKYPVHYLVNEDDDDENTTSLYTLQIGGDTSSNRFLYGERDKAANVMMELLGWHGEKKNTPVRDYSIVKLQFSYLLQGATIPHASNFRLKDIMVDDMEKPELEKLKQIHIADLPKAPQIPQRFYPTPYDLGTFGCRPGWQWYVEMRPWQKTPEIERRKKRYEQQLVDYDNAKKRYKAEKENYDREVQNILRDASGKTQEEYGLLKAKWDQHQKVMNEFVAFKNMVFQIDYCDADNKKNFVAQKKAAAEVLKAEKKSKAEELAKEHDNNAREAKAAAVEKDHNERVEKRVKYMLQGVDINWVRVKPRLERVKLLMEKTKADRLDADIQKKEDAITKLAEYDLDLDDLEAGMHMHDNPFYKDASAKIEIPK